MATILIIDDRPQNREYLAALPATLLVDGRFFAVHGALHPQPNDELHLSNDARVARSFEELATGRFGSTICFFGHNHRPAIYEHKKGGFHRIAAPRARLLPDAHYLINPGSVGQPRDGNWRAAYGIFDSELREFEIRRVPYDIVRAEQSSWAARLSKSESVRARAADWLIRTVFDDGTARRLWP